MNLKKYLGIVVLASLLASCSKEHQTLEEPNVAEAILPLEDKPVSLDIEALPEEEEAPELKAWSYGLGAKGTTLNFNDKDQAGKKFVEIPSVCILSNANGSTKYVFNISWKKPKGKNELILNVAKLPERDLFNKAIKLSLGTWYIAGILDKSARQGNANINFDPNGFGSTDSPRLEVYAPNTKISKDVPIYLPWSKLTVESKNGELIGYAKSDKGKSVTFKSFGNMLRITVTNEANYTTRVKGLSLESNVVRTSSGSFNLASTSNPSVGKMAFSWVPTRDEDTQAFSIDPYNLDANGGKLGKSYVLWVASVATKNSARPMTHIVASVKRTEAGAEKRLPQMNRLYIWGSTEQPTSGKKFHAKASIQREKQILEYFSFDIMKNGVDDGYTQEEARKKLAKMSDRKFPHINELRALAPGFKTTKLNNFFGHGDVVATNLTYRVNGVDDTYTDIFRNGRIMYGLRSDGTGRRYYAAWRYNPDAKPSATIQSIYLGKHYKGSIDDIANEAFWTTHQKDIIERSFSKGYLYSFKNEIRWGLVVSSAEGLDAQTFYSIGNSMQDKPFGAFRENKPNTIYGTVLPLEKPNTPWKD